jgi:sterol desaturase/sphingolipid hydroxylase (fatty acid hydroxylase superfamily)
VLGNDAWILRSVFQWGGLLLFLALEVAAPYRPSTVSKVRRWGINLALLAGNGVVLTLVAAPLTLAAVGYAEGQRAGLLYLLPAGPWLRGVVAVIFLDFVLYVWHLLNHEMPTLWRFHRVHHSDLNMDVSTAGRFHLGELAVSALIKIGLVYFLGTTLWELTIFETLLVLSAQFQHSSVRVPMAFERVFWLLFVPPSMHRIHHSVVIRDRNTNYGTIFSVWDRLFGTFRTGVDQGGIRIGVGAYSSPEKLGIRDLLSMPFTRLVP